MSPKLRTPTADPFDEETKRTDSAAPSPLDNETTEPVDVHEMEAAAKASRFVPDPASRPATLLKRETPPVPYAELQVPGDPRVLELPAHRVSATGLALEVPKGISLTVEEGMVVGVYLHLESERQPLRSRARVAHYRAGKEDRAGGVALRWEPESADDAAELERVRAGARPS